MSDTSTYVRNPLISRPRRAGVALLNEGTSGGFMFAGLVLAFCAAVALIVMGLLCIGADNGNEPSGLGWWVTSAYLIGYVALTVYCLRAETAETLSRRALGSKTESAICSVARAWREIEKSGDREVADAARPLVEEAWRVACVIERRDLRDAAWETAQARLEERRDALNLLEKSVRYSDPTLELSETTLARARELVAQRKAEAAALKELES